MSSTPGAPTRTTTADGGALDRFFEISKRGSTVGTELRGGLVTFVTMAYIVILNPLILSTPDVEGTVLSGSAVAAATALTAGVMTVLFGLVTRLPFAFAAGLGINAFLAFSIVGSISWPEAMALVVINGVIIVLLAATGLRKMIFDAVPMPLKLAITAGIGLFSSLAKRIARHRASILAAIEHHMSNGRVESVNTKIRLITRVAFGFRSPHALIALAMLRLGGHRPALPGHD